MNTSNADGHAANPVTLARQLREASACVLAVEQGRSLSDALAAVAPALRPGAQALSFHALRQLGLSRACVRLLAPRSPAPPVRALLHVVLPLLDAQEPPDAPRYPPHTVVSQAVEAAKGGRETRALAGFVNACLRRFLREGEAIRARAQAAPEARWNHPAWWVEQLRRDHPAHWDALLAANNRPAPMALRVNRRRIARDAYWRELQALGLEAVPVGVDGLVLARPAPVERLPGFGAGWVSVQDPAAQQAAPLLLDGWQPPAGARVLDACAAPGGKTAHLLECADLDVWALELDPRRLPRIQDNLTRLGLHAHVRQADAGAPERWWDGVPFDAILLDAPCTASGIVRRHPDVRWLRRPGDVAQLAATQRRLLDALWPLLKPGGRLLYATCSVFLAEGSAQVQAFLERHTDARLGPAPGHLLPPLAGAPAQFNDNAQGEHDGFFYARLDKLGDPEAGRSAAGAPVAGAGPAAGGGGGVGR